MTTNQVQRIYAEMWAERKSLGVRARAASVRVNPTVTQALLRGDVQPAFLFGSEANPGWLALQLRKLFPASLLHADAEVSFTLADERGQPLEAVKPNTPSTAAKQALEELFKPSVPGSS